MYTYLSLRYGMWLESDTEELITKMAKADLNQGEFDLPVAAQSVDHIDLESIKAKPYGILIFKQRETEEGGIVRQMVSIVRSKAA